MKKYRICYTVETLEGGWHTDYFSSEDYEVVKQKIEALKNRENIVKIWLETYEKIL